MTAATTRGNVEAITRDVTSLLVRPRLLRRLSSALAAPVAVVHGPAGYGKTTLVEQWGAGHPATAMLTLNLGADDDLSRVVLRLVTATAATWRPLPPDDAGRMFRALGSLDPHDARRVLADAAQRATTVLVLDRADAPRNAQVVEFLQSLLRRPPTGLHVIAITRGTRAVHVRELLRTRDVSSVGPSDLELTAGEVQQLISHVAGRDVTPEELTALHGRTRGWPVVLHRAAIAFRRPRPAREIIEGISDDRQIASFISSEVLRSLSPRMRRFLLRTSPLDPLVGGLCDAVVGTAASAVMLRLLADDGVPMHADASVAGAVSVHPLVRQQLLHGLRQSEPEVEGQVLRAAADWHAQHGDPETAARYLSDCEDWRGLVDLADRFGRDAFCEGRADRVLTWIERVPDSSDFQGTGVIVRRAYLHTMLGQTRRAEHLLRDVDAHGPSLGERAVIETLRATWAFFDARPATAVTAADDALELLDQIGDDPPPSLLRLTARVDLWAMATGSKARALWALGDLVTSRQLFGGVLERRDVYALWRTHVHSALALLEAWAGDFVRASAHAQQAFHLAAAAGLRNHPAVTDAYLARAHVLRERGHLERSRAALDAATAIAHLTRRPTTRTIIGLESAWWLLAAGVPDRALRLVHQHQHTDEAVSQPLLQSRLLAARIRLELAVGHVDRARDLLTEAAHPRCAELAAVAVQVALTGGDVDRATTELDEWPATEGSARSGLERDLLHALVDFEAGHRPVAIQRLDDVLTRAHPQGHVRLFLDAGPPMEPLLRAMARWRPTPYVRHLRHLASTPAVAGTAADDLSERELEVLRYLPTPLGNAEIAEQLYVSLNTLKTHLRTIYRKLGVHDRRGAIVRAEHLGLL
jgi:LuxR family maltose regulon positive regulatory protein